MSVRDDVAEAIFQVMADPVVDPEGYFGRCADAVLAVPAVARAIAIIEVTPHVEELATCDWGGCNSEAVSWRWDHDGTQWLPVCRRHRVGVR